MNVMRFGLTLTAFLLTTNSSFADEILGTWLRDNGAEQVKFEPCGDAICGDIVATKYSFRSSSSWSTVPVM